MSSALVRQALEFVDPEATSGKRKKRGAGKRRSAGQDHIHPYRKSKKSTGREEKTSDQATEENIKKLLALSQPTADPSIAKKIVARAVKGKPLLDKIETKPEEIKSILFTDEQEESFTKFEREYFCS